MSTAAKNPPALTQAEWDVIIELLKRERSDLPAEIHHTRTTEMRDQLHQRLELVDRLLARLSGLAE